MFSKFFRQDEENFRKHYKNELPHHTLRTQIDGLR